MIATSINMQIDTFTLLSRAAVQLNTSRRAIIVRLLMRIMHNISRHQGGFTSVRYQPGNSEKRWHCFSIRFKPDENEFFMDLRKLCKCSVSLLVAIAVEKYLDEMIRNKKRTVYNNIMFENYLLSRTAVDGIISWQIHWGTPKSAINGIKLE
jgi:hypothetical protein